MRAFTVGTALAIALAVLTVVVLDVDQVGWGAVIGLAYGVVIPISLAWWWEGRSG